MGPPPTARVAEWSPIPPPVRFVVERAFPMLLLVLVLVLVLVLLRLSPVEELFGNFGGFSF